jgi:hypothetical protein
MGVPDANRMRGQAALTLRIADKNLSGTFVFEGDRRLEIQEGTVDGSKLSFVVRRDRSQGGVMVYKMTGTMEGDQIRGRTETEMDGQLASEEWSAKRK